MTRPQADQSGPSHITAAPNSAAELMADELIELIEGSELAIGQGHVPSTFEERLNKIRQTAESFDRR